LGISTQLIDNTLYDAFGQRQVSTLYTPLNQYHVVMEVAPRWWQSPQTLERVYVSAPDGGQVPLSAVTQSSISATALSVNHRALAPAVTLSFNLPPGVPLSQAGSA
jgi:multidrug efflux pump